MLLFKETGVGQIEYLGYIDQSIFLPLHRRIQHLIGGSNYLRCHTFFLFSVFSYERHVS